jgi:PqqD family protein of HPr-rel-A system
MIWHGVDKEVLLWEQFGEDYVIYHVQSGETHYLNGTAAAVLRRLQQGPASLENLAEALGLTIEAGCKPALARQLSRALQAFSHAGLAWPADP